MEILRVQATMKKVNLVPCPAFGANINKAPPKIIKHNASSDPVKFGLERALPPIRSSTTWAMNWAGEASFVNGVERDSSLNVIRPIITTLPPKERGEVCWFNRVEYE